MRIASSSRKCGDLQIVSARRCQTKEARRGAPPLAQSALRCLPGLLHPFFHIFGCHIFHVSGDAPEVSTRILKEARAVSVKLGLNRLQDFPPFPCRPVNYTNERGKGIKEAYRACTDGD